MWFVTEGETVWSARSLTSRCRVGRASCGTVGREVEREEATVASGRVWDTAAAVEHDC